MSNHLMAEALDIVGITLQDQTYAKISFLIDSNKSELYHIYVGMDSGVDLLGGITAIFATENEVIQEIKEFIEC